MTSLNKRLKEQHYTECNPFLNKGFFDWQNQLDLKKEKVLEPFAGSNNLINMFQEMNLCDNFIFYDIKSKYPDTRKKDTLQNFPQNI